MIVFEGETADQVWQKAMLEFDSGEHNHSQTGRNGSTNELLHTAFTIHNPRERWIIARKPALNPAFAIAEVIWILCGRQDSAFLNYWNTKLPKYGGNTENYHGAYGSRLRKHFGIDQLERAYSALKNNPDGRQVVLQIWDAQIDLPDEQGKPADMDIPCNITALLKVRNGKLEWMQITRSNDMFLGVPHNFVQFTSIQEIVAGWLGVEVGSYNHISDSLHIYDTDINKMSVDSSTAVQANLDDLSLPKDQSEIALNELNYRIDAMTKHNMVEADLMELSKSSKISGGFSNLLFVNCAEAARRKGWETLSSDLIAKCTNPILLQVWDRWLIRVKHI